tara:strand:+ start:71898 stop:72254 length:357 start_codon:yes stop_codon:yes gene_type:complete
MKKFKIESTHTIHKDSYNDGEGDYCNEYDLDCEISAPTFMEAIIHYFENHLYYNFDKEKAHIDYESNTLQYDNLVDDDNTQVLDTDNKYNLWMNDQVQLYNNHTLITVKELVTVNLYL